jgi:hypothetical protein
MAAQVAPDVDALYREHRSTDSYTEAKAVDATIDCIDPRLERDADTIDAVVEATKISVTQALQN